MGNVFSSNKKHTRLEAKELGETVFDCYTEVSSLLRNAKIESVTDETFGEAINLIKPTKANTDLNNLKQEEENRDGWIVKRHETQARVIITLCNASHIHGFDIDTTGFSNVCPTHALIEGYRISDEKNDGMWVPLVEEEVLHQNSHNFFQVNQENVPFSRVCLTVTPGGGIARFRTYGDVIPDLSDATKEYNLASANYGARIVRWSDTEHANEPNVLLDNGTLTTHGWLTPRSREQDRNDFIVIQLAAPGRLNSIVVDTTGFQGNTPMKIRIEGCETEEDDPYQDVYTQWIPLFSESDITEETLNTFPVLTNDTVTHVRLTLLPDGGLQQIMCYGFIEQPKQNKQLEYSAAKLLTNVLNEANPSFVSEGSVDIIVAESEVVNDEEEIAKEKEDVIMDKPAIEELNVCNTPLSPPSHPQTTDAYKKQPTLPITDRDLLLETVIEELNGSTTQLLTSVTEKVSIIGNKDEITPDDKEELATSEKADIEQLNATNTQLSPPSVAATETSTNTQLSSSAAATKTNDTTNAQLSSPSVTTTETSDDSMTIVTVEEDITLTEITTITETSTEIEETSDPMQIDTMEKESISGGKRKVSESDLEEEPTSSKSPSKRRDVKKSYGATRRSTRSSSSTPVEAAVKEEPSLPEENVIPVTRKGRGRPRKE